MKKLICLLLVIGCTYGAIGNTLVEAGTKSITSTASKMQEAGV